MNKSPGFTMIGLLLTMVIILIMLYLLTSSMGGDLGPSSGVNELLK